MTTARCSVRYDFSGERCGEPAVRAYRFRYGVRFVFHCAGHPHPPLATSPPLWSEVPVAFVPVASVMES